jgi:hypothetical protein
MPTAHELAGALKIVEMNPGQVKMLRAHFFAPAHTITSTQLAEALDTKGTKQPTFGTASSVRPSVSI